jgi:hypothetical protein
MDRYLRADAGFKKGVLRAAFLPTILAIKASKNIK